MHLALSRAEFEIGSLHLGQPRFTRRVPQLLARVVYTWDLKRKTGAEGKVDARRVADFKSERNGRGGGCGKHY